MFERHHATTALLALVVTAALAASTAAVAPASAAAPAADANSVGDGASLLQQQNATIQVGSGAVSSGENTTVTLSTDAADVAGYQANITFDQSVVKVENVAGTEDFDEPAVRVNNEKGELFITQSSPEGSDAPALARVTFYAVGDNGERSKLTFENDTYLNDADAQTVDVATSPGSLQVTDGEFVAMDDGTTAPNGTTTPSDQSGGASVLSGLSLEIVGGLAVVVGAVALGVLVGRRT